MAWPDGIRGLLLDVDGTLLEGDAAIPGAAETIDRLRRSGVSFRCTTNTTRRSRREIAEALAGAGIAVRSEEILIPASLARRRILESGRTRALLLLPESSKEDMDGIVEEEGRPDWVVVGDLAHGFTFDRINRAFLALRDGSTLLALHKNRYWQPVPGTLQVDAGPFVAALEYAAGVEAEVVGKPSPAFFRLAVGEIGLPPDEILVVGDSVATDGLGARAAGLKVVFVRTGVFREDALSSMGIVPELVLDSIADLGVKS
jgi:HAD superfamily hydrolase (TIGR01458 family)